MGKGNAAVAAAPGAAATRSLSTSTYRPEIDGLRALAVIAVIINHFNPERLPSGFLGVDIFFVISGFVVTASLGKKTHDLSWQEYLVSFYVRRIKRLFPALVTCVAITSLVGCWFIDQPATSLRTGIASLVGVSNLYLFKQSVDYFGQSAEFNLFTQTWSLGVEEQFYLVFPILLGLCGFSRHPRRGGKRNLCLAVLLLGIISTIGYWYLVPISPSAAFFLMPSRFWEVGAGCLAFLAVKNVAGAEGIRRVMAGIAVVALTGGLFVSKDLQAFSTLATVLLTCVVLLSLEANKTLFRVFSHRWLVQVGRLSYSLYLWHWSVLVISRWTVGISKWTIPLQVLLMVGLALLSYFLIEKPLRHAQWSSGQVGTIVYGLGGISASALFLLGLMVPLRGKLYLGQAFPEAKSTSFKLAKDYKECRDASSAAADFSECVYPTDRPDAKTVYFVGDSHSVSLKALASRLVEQGQVPRIAMVGRNKCFFSTSLVRQLETGQQLEKCRSSAQAFVAKVLETGREGDIVVLTNRYLAYFLTPNYFSDAARVRRGDFSLLSAQMSDQTRLSQAEALTVYTRELLEMSQALAAQGIALVVQAPLPDWKHLPHECQPEWFRTAMALPETCRLSAAVEAQRRLPVVEAFQQAAMAADNLYVFDPFAAFCQGQTCSPFSADGVPLFKDDDHLNNYGAEALYDDFTDFLRQHGLT